MLGRDKQYQKELAKIFARYAAESERIVADSSIPREPEQSKILFEIASKKQFEAMDQEVKNLIDKSVKPLKPTKRQAMVLGVMAILTLFGLIGCFLEAGFGKHFIFLLEDQYIPIMPKLFFGLLPVYTLGVFIYPTVKRGWKYWLASPGLVCIFSFISVFAPFGWAALVGTFIGHEVERQSATVISISQVPFEQRRPSRCDENAELNYQGTIAEICIEGRLVGAFPKAGDNVALSGRLSWLGLKVDSIKKI